MMEIWGIELLYALGRMFLNPLLYWAILLLIIAGARRVKRERINFGVKVYESFSEISGTLLFSLLFSFIISIVSVLSGFVLSIEILIVLAIVSILLSINGSFQSLSAAYTLGFTFIIFMLLPLLPNDLLEPYFSTDRLMNIQYVTIAVLLSLFLYVESLLILLAKNKQIYPALSLSDRGVWIGEHQLKRMALIPFLVFIPAGNGTDIAPILPYFQIGNESFYLAFVPFILGTQFTARTEYMFKLKRKIAKQKLVLSLFVFIFAVLSYYYFIFALVAIIIAILGNEWITFRNRTKNIHGKAVLAPTDEGVKIIGTIPGSKADELEILPGEVITKVNDKKVSNSDEFYKALQQSGAFFKLDVVDKNGEVRFIKSAFYAEDHHDLGLLFPEAPYHEKQKERIEQLKAL